MAKTVGIAPTLFTAMPQLNKENYPLWWLNVEQLAAEHKFADHLSEYPAPISEDYVTRRAQAIRLLTTTISPNILSSMSADFLSKSPYG